MFKVNQVKVHIFWIPKCLQPLLCPRSLTVVNILGSQKPALFLDVP